MNGRDGGTSRPDLAQLDSDDLGKLLAAMADGEHDAFEQFCAQLSGPIYGTAVAVVRDRAHAEEVTQEVLTEIWLLAFRYDSGRGSPAVWALTIARRRAIDRVRSIAAASALERRAALAPATPDQVVETVEETLEAQRLSNCLDRLTHLQRQSIVLAFYGGHTYPQVASILGVAVSTVKARIRDALTSLRGCMHEDC